MRMLRAGSHPPTFIPFCSLCDLPVAKISYRVPKEDVEAIEFEGACCGRTMGRRVKLAEIARIRETGEKFYLVVQKNRFQEIRKQARQ